MRSHTAAALLTVLTLALAAGCGGGGGGGGSGKLLEIEIEPSDVVLGQGSTYQYTAKAVYSGKPKTDITTIGVWSSSAPAVMTVSAGLAAALSEGTAVISVSYEGFTHAIDVTVMHYPRAFVTSVSGTGNLASWPDAGGKTGLAAADAVCQARAQAAGLPGTFRAWLSDSTNDAQCRVTGHSYQWSSGCGIANGWTTLRRIGPWVRTDGFVFLPGLDDGTETPASFDEFGRVTLNRYWTAARASGGSRSDCGGWTDGSVDTRGNAISAFRVGQGWIDAVPAYCDFPFGLLCMEEGSTNLPYTYRAAGKLAFVTSVQGSGNLGSWADAGGLSGTTAGDAICRAHAVTAGLANPARFKAWLSDSTTSAIDRLTSDGPWVRVDGMPLAANKAALTTPPLFTAIDVDETGKHTSAVHVWTGTNSDGRSSLNHCGNWTGESGGTFGDAVSAEGWTMLGTILSGCQDQKALYCFED